MHALRGIRKLRLQKPKFRRREVILILCYVVAGYLFSSLFLLAVLDEERILSPGYSEDFHETAPIRSTLSRIRRWYFSNVSARSIPVSEFALDSRLWPDDTLVSDRIERQLLFYPDSKGRLTAKLVVIVKSTYNKKDPRQRRPGKILDHDYEHGRGICPVTHCTFTSNERKAHIADAILFVDGIPDWYTEIYDRPQNQVWILSLLESPYHTRSFSHAQQLINWTATYRLDSDLVTPYGKFALYNTSVRQKTQEHNYALTKSGPGKVAWFVSNCETGNKRMDYARELGKYIHVDIYGRCGTLDDRQCQKSGTCDLLLAKSYKFYLAFENNNCRWYITEKLWTALKSNVIPVVMGAPISDYEAVAPYRSFIHVDNFTSPQELANYLHYLDNNENAYNEYFKWKHTGEIILTYTFCRICCCTVMPDPKVTRTSIFGGIWAGPCVLTSH
ncbi:glycoprotein 3-alpha-L-fucosyltransferase A-like isoform X2 [Paramacrobiotus metropolitanus]|uniref:glycoprotein 3-alpha-L-fucosyltransferase A-like isoform X2 n=1 Tax=Paramacrobiotus metropolitanus TaxID=2943436 RepID=UPI0024457E86|nr:glycoprotein 3-alpha-L-fucosyltransferase A-like isoform X2 [Paramacrobiotus metropolitanus]